MAYSGIGCKESVATESVAMVFPVICPLAIDANPMMARNTIEYSLILVVIIVF